MSFIQGSTPTIKIGIRTSDNLIGFKLFGAVEQGKILISKNSSQVTLTTDPTGVYTYIASFSLTQEETWKLVPGPCKVQVRWIGAGGLSGGTPSLDDIVEKSIVKGVISYA